MEAVWNFYGPWMRLMLQVGVPLVLLATPTMLLFERGSFLRWISGRAALIGWTLVLLALVLYLFIRIFENAFASLTT